jgi:hypothetical protein
MPLVCQMPFEAAADCFAEMEEEKRATPRRSIETCEIKNFHRPELKSALIF